MASRRVLLFSQPGCIPCSAAKRFLTARDVAFEYKDIAADAEALRELTDTYGSRSTPTIVVGERVMIGFVPEELEAMLGAE